MELETQDDFLQSTEKKTFHKISFKCRKTSLYHHNINSNTTNTNMVAFLASKFNQIDEESDSKQAGINRLIKRINSYKATQQVDKVKRTIRKPSVKMKPVIKPSNCDNETAQDDVIIEKHVARGNVRAAIENFERRSLEISPIKKTVPKPLVLPLKEQQRFNNNCIQMVKNEAQLKTDVLKVQINASSAMHNVHLISPLIPAIPNTSFLWRKRSQDLQVTNEESYEVISVQEKTETELIMTNSTTQEIVGHCYEYCHGPPNYEDLEDHSQQEDIYETIPYFNKNPLVSHKQQEPLPPRPMSWTDHLVPPSEGIYESIYNMGKVPFQSDNYESIYDFNNWETASNQGSLISDQKSNSLYERAPSACSTINNEQVFSDSTYVSDKSDEWIDVSDNEASSPTISPFVVIRTRHRNRPTGWTQKIRDQWNKTQSEKGDADHHYETLCSSQPKDIYDSDDSFESDSEAKNSFEIINNLQLPDPPTHGLTKLAASAGKHMKRLRRNWSLTKNDITKSFKRIRKRKPAINLDRSDKKSEESQSSSIPTATLLPESNKPPTELVQELKAMQLDVDVNCSMENKESDFVEKRRSDGFLNKFRRSISVSSNEYAHTLNNRTKSTFYLTDTIDVDKTEEVSPAPASPVIKRNSKPVRPQSPPPPIPVEANQNLASSKTVKEGRRSTSWYAEVGLFKNSENVSSQRPNTSWYAEIGLYNASSTGSTPNTSSAENSGNTNTSHKAEFNEEYHNLKNGSDSSHNSTLIVENCYNNQLRLQDEPLYQFYDAAIFEDSMDDFDSDGYEDIYNSASNRLTSRPSAMELVLPNKNGVSVTRTLWSEVPEVIQSTVLSTLNAHQKKLQEAKFELITSEASYLNSLNVLWDHFVTNLYDSDLLSNDEKYILFGKIKAVKRCSKNLLSDMEKCWQDNILLTGICDIVKKHVDNNFIVYVPYCENQTLLDSTLRKLRERVNCKELLKQLEESAVCQALGLHSFLLLPMQRITRWPLLVDAVLKRLSPEDNEYLNCQYALGALNKIVTDCNEAARKKEQETEIKKISEQIEFPKNISIINLISPVRWLVRSGPLVHMQARADDIRLTFGKRFSKIPVNLFLFNDLLIICKPKSDGNFNVLHYCFRSYIDLNTNEIIQTLPNKETQGRNLLFLTLLENHERKMVEMLLACSSESDRERWIEALSAPKSDDPDEILYDCWDCPQVTAAHSYIANQPDELALNRGDVVNVDRKMADGWYHGERLRDGQMGWFPGNHTVEIANPHVRARNLKQRYRFLALSQNYLKAK